MMNTILRSSDFDTWLKKLNDQQAKDRILIRLKRATKGTTIYLLLAGGDKSTQEKDIARAKSIAREFKEMKP